MSIEVRGLSFSYDGERETLRSLTFSVGPGELCALVGPSGSGKSTLLQLVAGLLAPGLGSVRVFGADPAGPGRALGRRALVCLVTQTPERQFFNETVHDEVAFALRRTGLPLAEVERRVEAALRDVGLDPQRCLFRSPMRLSGGEQRSVAIAVALALEPRALLLDEPTAGLDPRTARRILDHLDAWRRARGAPVILVTHDPGVAGSRADRVLALSDGEAVYFGTPGEFFTRTELLAELGLEEPATAAFLRLLRERGISLPYPLFDVEEAASAVAEARRRGELLR